MACMLVFVCVCDVLCAAVWCVLFVAFVRVTCLRVLRVVCGVMLCMCACGVICVRAFVCDLAFDVAWFVCSRCLVCPCVLCVLFNCVCVFCTWLLCVVVWFVCALWC